MSKFQDKHNNYQKALSRLNEAVEDYEKYKMSSIRDGVIQRFEFTTDLAWKTTHDYLSDKGINNLNTPKAIIKEAFAINLIDNENEWNQILTDRTTTASIYNEDTANDILERIINKHILLLKDLSNRFCNQN